MFCDGWSLSQLSQVTAVWDKVLRNENPSSRASKCHTLEVPVPHSASSHTPSLFLAQEFRSWAFQVSLLGIYPRWLRLWKAGLFLKGAGSPKQPFAVVLHIHRLPVIHDHVCAHITDSALFTSWAAGTDARELGGTGQPSRFLHKDFLISSHASVLFMSVCLVICSTLCTLRSSYRLAFYFLQQFLSLCQHLAICSFNAYR